MDPGTCSPLMPKISDDTAPFWQGCKERRLLFQRCSECGNMRYPASIVCPDCHSTACEWVESKGEGRIYSFVVFRRAFHPAMDGRIPYVVAVVELDEGPSFLTNIVGTDPAQIRCDQRVRLTWEKMEDGLSLPVFRIAESGEAA
jgi:uncharacterized OB-fold protein